MPPKSSPNTSFNWSDPLLLQEALTDDERLLAAAAQKFCSDKLMGRVRDDFRHEKFDPSILTDMGAMGFLGPTWQDALGQAAMPCGPISTIEQVFADPQIIERGVRTDLTHASADTVPSVACPIRLQECVPSTPPGPPLLGEHTNEILSQILGLRGQQIDKLRSTGVV